MTDGIQLSNFPTLNLPNSDVGVADARTGASITTLSGAPTGPTVDRAGAGAEEDPPTSPAHHHGAGGHRGAPRTRAGGSAHGSRAHRLRHPGIAPAGRSARSRKCPVARQDRKSVV